MEVRDKNTFIRMCEIMKKSEPLEIAGSIFYIIEATRYESGKMVVELVESVPVKTGG